jgi:hypothetical protein
LPEDLRDYSRVLDKSALSSLLKDVARKYPERYREISFELSQVGRRSAQEQGGFSFGARHLRKSKAAQAIQQKIKSELMGILSDGSLTDQQRTDKIVRVVGRESSAQQKAVLEEAVKENNPLGLQVLSGSRGKPMNLASLLAADMLYSDHRDEVIPIPVLRSYSQGLTPAEYWAGTYGARRGIIATKFATQEAGFLCLAGDTMVRMADWSVKAIRDIKPGDMVIGSDKSGNTFPVKVSAKFENGKKELWRFRFKADKKFVEIVATKEHKALIGSLHRQCSSNGQIILDVTKEVLPFSACEHYLDSPAVLVTANYDVATSAEQLFFYSDKEYVGIEDTFDIEVDHPDHLFVLENGAIVSNSKQLNQAGHRLVVVDEDTDEVSPVTRGLIVDTDDMDNEGALLAQDTGPFKRNTPLTPKILKQLKRLGKDRILVRSPLVGGSPEGGVYARDVGVREKGLLPGRGEQVGLQAAQALSEPISQGQLSAKHSGGVAGQEKAVGGFQYINQLIQTPKKMQGGAAHSTVDGMVQRVEPAPAGGSYVIINGEKHYVNAGYELKVKKGDEVEAGDLISDGIPNPAIITKYKGVGEGRRYFVREFKKAMASSGMFGHRRNIELLARGLINHVRLTEEVGEHVQDDIIPYSTLEHTYTPREGFQALAPKKAVGKYLERPVLHYTIGTKVRPSMLKDFDEFGVTAVDVHDNPPPFESHMVRGMYQLQHDPDWLTQMYGSGLKESLLESVARGGKSEQRGSSFVPSLATGTDFGDVPDRVVIKPQAPYALPNVKIPDLPDSLLSSPTPKMPEKLSASIMPPNV